MAKFDGYSGMYVLMKFEEAYCNGSQDTSEPRDLTRCFTAVGQGVQVLGFLKIKTRILQKASSHLLGQKSQEPQSKCGY